MNRLPKTSRSRRLVRFPQVTQSMHAGWSATLFDQLDEVAVLADQDDITGAPRAVEDVAVFSSVEADVAQ